jgi:hypothetical protein
MHRQQSLPIANNEPTFKASADIGEVTGVTEMAKTASYDHILPVSKFLSLSIQIFADVQTGMFNLTCFLGKRRETPRGDGSE